MFTGIDHIIIGVRDVAAATRTFEQDLGLRASGGGVHPVGGTANRVIVIGDTYLELITVVKPEEAQESLRQRLEQAEGYFNCVLASDALEADCQAMRRRGIPVIGPAEGTLRTGEGRERSWLRADIEIPDMVQRYPFLIQHDSRGEERRQRLAGWTTPPEHPLGAVGVHSVTLAVADLAEASSRFAHIYGLQPSAPFATGRARLVAFELGTGGQVLELAVPLDGTEASVPGETLVQRVERFGEGLARVTLLVKNLAHARGYLDARGIAYVASGQDQQALLWIDAARSHGAELVLRQA